MNTNNESIKFCVIGCGRLGTALSVFLSGKGFVAEAFSSKTRESAENAAGFTGAGKVYNHPCEAIKGVQVVFLTTPDNSIEPVCKEIADYGGFNKSHIVFHLSGALSSGILSSAGEKGAAIGSIHPLQAFAPYVEGQASQFSGINISIEGDEPSVEMGKQIVNALDASSFTIPTQAKTLYHASAVVASNYLVTLEHFAIELLKQANLSEQEAFQILKPLIMGTLKNIEARGCIKALTGPVARGDDEIVSRHLDDIDQKLPEFSDLYRLLGQHTLEIANQNSDPAGALTSQAKKALENLFALTK